MNSPIKPKFAFVANNASDEDKSGVAQWHIPIWGKGGEWSQYTLTLEFASFLDAHKVNNAMRWAWAAGEAAGHETCKREVLAALK